MLQEDQGARIEFLGKRVGRKLELILVNEGLIPNVLGTFGASAFVGKRLTERLADDLIELLSDREEELLAASSLLAFVESGDSINSAVLSNQSNRLLDSAFHAKSMDTVQLLAKCLFVLGKSEGVATLFKAALERNPTSPGIIRLIGEWGIVDLREDLFRFRNDVSIQESEGMGGPLRYFLRDEAFVAISKLQMNKLGRKTISDKVGSKEVSYFDWSQLESV